VHAADDDHDGVIDSMVREALTTARDDVSMKYQHTSCIHHTTTSTTSTSTAVHSSATINSM